MPTKIGRMTGPPPVFTGGASSDHGDVTLIAPTATIRSPRIASGMQGHYWSTVVCGFGTTGWKGLNAGAKAMAASAIDLLTRPETLQAVRKKFDDYAKTRLYKSFLPLDSEPALEQNEK